jgi:phosphoserine phosphatase RsbU/P
MGPASPPQPQPYDLDEAAALLDDDAEDLYEHAPCGYVSTLMDGTVVKLNATLLGWLGATREELVGRRRLSELLTVGGRLYYETHLAPLLRMQGEVGGLALELRAAGGGRLPVLVTAVLKKDADGRPTLIRATFFDARDRRAYEQELLRARRAAEHERERLEGLVAGLQRSLLPASLPRLPGLETAAHYHMASPDEIGGDFYDLFPLSAGRWGVCLGDVCGKGVDAAAVTALARYTLRAAAVYDPDPGAVLANLNEVLFQEHEAATHRYCTAVFGVLQPSGDGWEITYARGGHPSPLLLHGSGEAELLPRIRGRLIGAYPGLTYPTDTVRLGPGDTLLLYTDGLTEARTGNGWYGADALVAFANGLAPVDAQPLVAAVVELLASFGDGLVDDAAVLALGVPAA